MTRNSNNSADDVRRSAERMKHARNDPGFSSLRGLGVFGMIGWSIAVPTVAGAFLGLWLNRVAPQNFSWPIALILGGIVVGGIIAWGWLEKEGAEQNRRSSQDKKQTADDKGTQP